MLQGGMRSADVARAINCNVHTVRHLRQDGQLIVLAVADIQTSHLRYRMTTTTARVTPGTHNPSSAQTVRNSLRAAGLRACRPVVRQVLTRHHWQQHCLWALTHRRWTRQDWLKVLFTEESQFCLTRVDGRICIYLEVEGPSWCGEVCHSIIGLSLLSLQTISTLCVTGKTSSSLMWYPSCRLILT
uniref:Transposase Tc1-like domain-containing protein n=1 Tax=Oncorhynchus tshawytscha TaxID=74940 RepID=A0AAZ3QZS6_ONCTS